MRVLLDTSLLLPTLGIKIKRAEDILKKLIKHELYYSEYSILECLWIASSLKKRGMFKQRVFESGMRSIFYGYKRAEVNVKIILKAFDLYEMGQRPYKLHTLLNSTTIQHEVCQLRQGSKNLYKRKKFKGYFL